MESAGIMLKTASPLFSGVFVSSAFLSTGFLVQLEKHKANMIATSVVEITRLNIVLPP
jgi:hypothetical protein